MATATVKDKISVPKREYLRLKALDNRFREFLSYWENITDISEARKEVKEKKIIPQEKLFRRFGF